MIKADIKKSKYVPIGNRLAVQTNQRDQRIFSRNCSNNYALTYMINQPGKP
jgi:hypothetical protein